MVLAIYGDGIQRFSGTYREENLKKGHVIPIGALVEINEDDREDSPERGMRLFVAKHTRDCDGTPLYALSMINPIPADDFCVYAETSRAEKVRQILGISEHAVAMMTMNGYTDDCLTVIRLPSNG